MNHENDENCIKVLIEGLYRAKLKTIIDENEYLTAEHELSPMTVSVDETTRYALAGAACPVRSVC